MSELKKKIGSGLLWLGSASALTQSVTWLFTILIARLLTPADYGLFAIAGVYIGLIEFLNEFGIGSTIVQKENISEKEISGLFGVSLYWSLTLCILTFVFASQLASSLHGNELVSILKVLSFTFIVSSFKNIQYNLMVRSMRFKEIAKIETTSRIATSMFTYVLALSGLGVWALVFSYIAANVIQAACYLFYERVRYTLRPSLSELYGHISFGFQIILGRFLGAISGRAEIWVIGKLFGTQLLGVYTFAQLLAFKPIETIVAILNQVFFPIFSRMQNDQQNRNRYILKVLETELLIMLPIFLLISMTTDVFVPLILGAKWISVIPFLQFFAIGGIFVYLSNKATMILISGGKPKPQIWFRSAQLILLPGMYLVFGNSSDSMTILYCWAAVYPVLSLIYFGIMIHEIKLSFSTVVISFLPSSLASLIMTAAVLACKKMVPGQTWLHLILLVLVAVSGLLFSLAVFHRKQMKEIVMNLRHATS